MLKTLILLRLSSFWFLLFLSPVLNTKIVKKGVTTTIFSGAILPVFDRPDIREGLGGGQSVIIQFL